MNRSAYFGCSFDSEPSFELFLEKISLEEKIGQMLIVHFNGEDINNDAKILIQDLHVGGIIYYNWANKLTSPKQVQTLSVHLQELAKQTKTAIPLFISVDQEGGRVARLTQGFTRFPGNQIVASTQDPKLAKEVFLTMGKELFAVGINLNFSPVVDINDSPKCYIKDRSFGNAEAVSLFAKQALEGYQEANIISCLKHFPGYGDVEIDPHETLPVVKKSKQQLYEKEFLPYLALLSKVEMMMTSHLLVSEIDKKNCATTSKDIVNILRSEMKFDGVIITDSLIMEGLVKNFSSIEEAAIQAILAGHDLLLLGGKQLVGTTKGFELTIDDIKRIHQAIVDAVKSGRISEKRVNQSFERILRLKNHYQLAERTQSMEDLDQYVFTEKHQNLAKKLLAMTMEHESGQEKIK